MDRTPKEISVAKPDRVEELGWSDEDGFRWSDHVNHWSAHREHQEQRSGQKPDHGGETIMIDKRGKNGPTQGPKLPFNKGSSQKPNKPTSKR